MPSSKKNLHNKTKKNRPKNNNSKKNKPKLSEVQKYCHTYANTFSTFEEKYEKTLDKNLIKENRNVEQELIKMFNIPFTPGHIRPQDDYYTYINYQWLEKKHKELKKEKKYYVQVDSFRVTQEKVYYELMEIVKEYIGKNKSSKKGKAIKAVYDSLFHLDTKHAEDYIEWITNKIEEIISRGNLYELLGSINTNEIISWGCPIVWNVLRDEKNSSVYQSNI